MSQFVELTVTDIEKTTRDAVVVTLMPSDGSTLPFTQGQYLTFRREFDGVEIRRAYSISASVNDGHLRVGIKKVAGGAFSTWANEDMKVGDRIDALSPMGSFHVALNPEARRMYLGFAIGSGITPILSILKSTLEVEPNSSFTLVYANRNVNEVMFREELEDLKNQYMARLSLIHILKSEGQEGDLFAGRLDANKLSQLCKGWINITAVDTAFICGPEDAMRMISDSLGEHGLKPEQIRYELFAAAQTGRLATRAKTDDAETGGTVAARIIIDGTSHQIDMDKSQPVLDAALDAGLGAPYACRAGVCSTCRCKVLEGEVEMLTNHALEDYEVKLGYVLSCQSVPLTDRIVVEYEDH